MLSSPFNILMKTVNARSYLTIQSVFFEIFAKFCEVYFNYKTRYVVNHFNHDSAAELNNVCDFAIEILKFVKVRVTVLLRENPRAQDIIKNICFKISKLSRSN